MQNNCRDTVCKMNLHAVTAELQKCNQRIGLLQRALVQTNPSTHRQRGSTTPSVINQINNKIFSMASHSGSSKTTEVGNGERSWRRGAIGSNYPPPPLLGTGPPTFHPHHSRVHAKEQIELVCPPPLTSDGEECHCLHRHDCNIQEVETVL